MSFFFITTITTIFISLITFSSSSSSLPDQDIERFEKWLFPHIDASLNPIEIRRTPSMGFGAFAKRDLARGEIYSAIPLTHVISLKTVLQSPLATVCRRVLEHCPGVRPAFDCVAVFLVHERRLGDQSFWSPYLRLLPRSYYHLPTRFKRAQLAEHMQQSELKSLTLSMQAGMFQRWEELKQCLALTTTTTFELPNWYEFEWAQGVVGSRAIW